MNLNIVNTNNLVPTEFYLGQNYPNPFSNYTSIKFCIAYKTKVKLEILDADGNIIKTLLDEIKEAGTYELKIDASVFLSFSRKKTADEQEVNEETFLYRLKATPIGGQAGSYECEKRMRLLKLI
ncbi:MAG: hypothetical protein M1480_10140 [Bacteroidetes bacterium]|nr:hypothetical protein [Bacteroidota bacterium]